MVNLKQAMLLAAIALTVAPSAAWAAPSASEQHCIAEAPQTGSVDQATVHCYSTFAGAISAATGGAVNLTSATTSRSVSADELVSGSDSTLTTYVLSVDYKDANFSGSTFTWFQYSPCGYYQTSSMPSGWNDVISSVADYSGCATTFYHDSNFGGSTFRIGVNGAASSMGSFNDQASSQKWCPAYPCS
jgi:hypothetical protein